MISISYFKNKTEISMGALTVDKLWHLISISIRPIDSSVVCLGPILKLQLPACHV